MIMFLSTLYSTSVRIQRSHPEDALDPKVGDRGEVEEEDGGFDDSALLPPVVDDEEEGEFCKKTDF